jgi:hypothetical protein
MNSIARRIKLLENRLQPQDPIELTMPDGRTETLHGYSGDKLLDLFRLAMREEAAGQGYSRDVDLIRRSADGHEPGAHMVELIRSLLNSPAEGPVVAENG